MPTVKVTITVNYAGDELSQERMEAARDAAVAATVTEVQQTNDTVTAGGVVENVPQ